MPSQESPNQPPSDEELLSLSELMLQRAQRGYCREMSNAEYGTLSALNSIAASLLVLARHAVAETMQETGTEGEQ